MAIDHMYTEVTIALITFVIVFMLLSNLKKEGKSLPGPWGLPIFGNIFQLGELAHITLAQMKKKYGDVFLIKLGTVPVIVVSGQETIRKVLVQQGESFAARPKLYSMSIMADRGSLSFSTDFGESWKLHKKIAKNALRTFSKSEAKTSTCSCLLEEYVSTEAAELVTTLTDLTERNGYFDPANEIAYAVANVVCALCFGKRYEHTDKDFIGFIQINEEAQKASGSGAAADFIPLVRYLPLPGLKALIEIISRFKNFVRKRVSEHYATYDENYIRDITDALIALCDKRKSEEKTLSDDQILSTVGDIFGAGTINWLMLSFSVGGEFNETISPDLILDGTLATLPAVYPDLHHACSSFDTVSSALQWAFLYLLRFPATQKIIHEEIDEHIGANRLPRFEDRKELHYTEAFINEVLRHSSFSAFTLPHCTTKGVHLNGYFIPKDTCVLINQYQVNHDPSVWKNPESFMPDRFLEANGQLNRSLQENVLMFGMGVRMCLGEDIARNEIFLMVTTILQQLKLEHNLHEKLDLTPVNGMALKPQKYKLKALWRR